MGSSKKRKEKKRSRSRSPKKEKDRSSRKRRHREEEDAGEAADMAQKSKSSSKPTREKRRKKDVEEGELEDEEPIGASASGGGGEISMSIEETNKLRAQLGLAPLQVDEKADVKEVRDTDGRTMELVKVDGSEFMHKPAENWGSKKEAETIREKLQTMKEKRKLDEKLGQVKLLGEEDEEDSAVSWVEKSRRLEQERRLAEQREKMLQEMDEEFGVSDLIAEEKKKKPSPRKAGGGYGSKDLAGMTVQHSKEVLLQSNEAVLVLADKDVLDEGEDVLINPTISELEKWKKNAELRKQKPGYNPYDEELDEFGMLKRSMLSKYDEEIEGEKKESFKLSATGEADIRAERERAEMLAKLREGAESLELPSYQLANEYLTQEEMAKFKKPKKRVRKLRKRGGEGLKADDLLANANTTDEDFGSRQRGRGRNKANYESGHMEKMDEGKPEVKTERSDDEEDMEMSAPLDDDDIHNIVLSDDEAEQELQAALARTRQMQLMEAKKKVGVEKVVELLPKTEPLDEDEIEVNVAPGKIVMDSVSEYCRGLGDIPTYGMAGNRADVDDDDLIDVEKDKEPSTSRMVEEEEEEEADDRGGWYERDINDTERARSLSASRMSDEASREPILEEEPDMNNMGVGAALKLAVQKGYVKKDDGNRGGQLQLDHLKAQRFTVMDKQFHDIDDKYAKKLERMGGGGGPIVEFKEKGDYKPNVRLEYSDEKGRLLDEKDAFRYLSWKFHGKAPGKRKVEKRTKKLMEKELFNEMSSTDTPLGTLSKQIEKQRQLQSPFIVLSGTGSKDIGTTIKKE